MILDDNFLRSVETMQIESLQAYKAIIGHMLKTGRVPPGHSMEELWNTYNRICHRIEHY